MTRAFHVPGTGRKRKRVYWGRLHFRGPTFRPNYFQVTWEDREWAVNSLPRLEASGHKLQPKGTQLPQGVTIPLASEVNSNRDGPHALGGDSSLPSV